MSSVQFLDDKILFDFGGAIALDPACCCDGSGGSEGSDGSAGSIGSGSEGSAGSEGSLGSGSGMSAGTDGSEGSGSDGSGFDLPLIEGCTPLPPGDLMVRFVFDDPCCPDYEFPMAQISTYVYQSIVYVEPCQSGGDFTFFGMRCNRLDEFPAEPRGWRFEKLTSAAMGIPAVYNPVGSIDPVYMEFSGAILPSGNCATGTPVKIIVYKP